MTRARGARWLAALVMVALGSCGDDQTAAIDFELADAPETAASGFCSTAPAPLDDDDAGCLRISICRTLAAGCEPIELNPPGDPGDRAELYGVALDETRRVRFDARLGGGPFEIDAFLTAKDGRPIAIGRARNVRFDGGTVRVRMYRHTKASCAGARRSGGEDRPTLPRAFHSAVALPNDDVLVLGGVVGDGINAVGLASGVLLQDSIEVYSVKDERFHDVSVRGWDGRVFFSAVPIPSAGRAGPFRIRIVGGFTVAEASRPVLRFDILQSRSVHGSPVVPSADAVPAPTVDLVYDPENRSARIETPELSITSAAFNEHTGFGTGVAPETFAGVLLGITGGPMLDMGFPPGPGTEFAGAALFLDAAGSPVSCTGGGTEIPLLNPRWGGSITRINAGDGRALIWGGNVNQPTEAETLPAAGEIVTPASDCSTIPVAGGAASPDLLPEPSAFHTATAMGGGNILVAGGFRVSGLGDGALMGIERLLANPWIHILQFTGDRFIPVGVFDGGELGPGRVFHTATLVERATTVDENGRTTATEPAVILVGGATTMMGANLQPLALVQAVRLVEGNYVVEPACRACPEAFLNVPRWGHAVAPLPGGRLLVTGGFDTNPTGMVISAISTAEVLSIDEAPLALPLDQCVMSDPAAGTDAGPPPGLDGG